MKTKEMQSRMKILLATLVLLLSGLEFSYAQTNKAYGDNMVKIDSVLVGGNYQPVFAIYSGDINQDGNVDLIDFPIWAVDNNNFAFGYLVTDLNGDGNTDLIDFPIWAVNNSAFIGVMRPF